MKYGTFRYDTVVVENGLNDYRTKEIATVRYDTIRLVKWKTALRLS